MLRLTRKLVVPATIAATTAVLTAGLAAPPASATDDPAAWVEAEAWTPESIWTTPEGSIPDSEWAPQYQEGSEPVAARGVPNTPTVNSATGDYPWWATDDFELWENTTAGVNLANGNLLVSVTDFQASAPGIDPRITRYYNSRSTRQSASLGNWILGVGPDVGVRNHPVSGATNATFYAPNGAETVYSRNGAGVTTVTPQGTNTTASGTAQFPVQSLTYNQSGAVMTFNSATQPTGTVQSQGWLTGEVDRNGVGLAYRYNFQSTGSLAFEVSDATGRVHRFRDGNLANTPSNFLAADGRQWSYAFNSSRLATVTGPTGGVTQYTYSTNGLLTRIVAPAILSGSNADATRLTVSFTYDSQGRVRTVTRGTETNSGSTPYATTTYSYSAGSTTVTDPMGNASIVRLDSSGRVTSATDPLGNTSATTWTGSNAVASTSNAAAGSTGGTNLSTTTYDSLGNASSATLPTGAAARAVYAQGVDCPSAGTGNPYLPHCTIDGSGNTTSNTYDANGNRTGEARNGATRAWTYETDGSICGGFKGQVCSATDGNGGVTSYAYDAAGNLTSVTPPAPLAPTTLSYDLASRLITATTNGVRTDYVYDQLDRVLSETFSTSTGGTTYYRYSTAGRLNSTSWDHPTRTERYLYNAIGLETSRIVTGSNGATVSTITAAYDAGGRMTSYTTSAGTVRATYDAANRMTSISQPGTTCQGAAVGTAGCVFLQYDADGNETLRSLPGGASVASTYDASGRLLSYTAKDGSGQTRSAISYSYTTAAGLDSTFLQSQTATMAEGVPAGAVTAYTYDGANRLTQASETNAAGPTATWGYAYDANSNLTQRTRAGQTGTPAGTTTFTYNAANQITSSSPSITTWAYDAVGQMTRNGLTGAQALYGARSQVQALGSGTYQSYGQGNSVTTADATGTTFQIGFAGVMQRSQSNTVTSYVRNADGGLIGLDTGPNSHYFVLDIRGSVVGLFNDAGVWQGGYSYSPTGEQRAISTNAVVQANQLRYVGGEAEGSLYRLGARYYDPSLGSFTQMDPSGQEANPYAYSASNPVNFSDPSGLDYDWVAFGNALINGFFSAVVGLVVGSICYGLATGATVGTGGLALGSFIVCGGITFVLTNAITSQIDGPLR